jgi:undecaprenyl-diphosphatase
MITNLAELDEQLFLTLNGLHASWLDNIMVMVSGNVIWLPLYALLLYHIAKLPSDTWVALLCVALTITVCDQLTSTILKPLVVRPRPTWNDAIMHLVHTVNGYRGGNFGFPSSHAANTFGVAIFLNLALKKRWLRWLLLWAALVSYSRIYLGVHYPGDVFAGALIGGVCGWLVYRFYLAITLYLTKKRTSSLP